MGIRANNFLKRRGVLKIGCGLLAMYFIAPVGYYYLPWTVRKEVYFRAPTVDRALRERGFNTLQEWDDLALIGRDASVPVEKSFRGNKAYGGFPSQGFKVFGRVNVLENRGYVTGYSESMRNPLWVSYRLFDVPKLESAKRPSRFSTDPRTRAKVSHDDYTNSGFDRGHMAPNFGIATRYGPEAQKETFLMSNIIPQTPFINRHLWKDLEMRVADGYGRYFREVWVVTGPVFQGEIKRLPSGVPIPSHYYKIMADEHDGKLRTLAFLIERDCPPYTRIKKRLVSIDEIEQLTDLDFFPDLPASVQNELESKSATRLWPSLFPSIEYRTFGKTD
jgi:endonuclease G